MIDYAGMTRMNGFGRTGRGRLFVCLGVIVLILGLILVKIQLDEEREMKERCEYNIEDLQNKIKVDRLQYEQLKSNMERTMQESNTKLTSLQQHYKLLKNEYDDFKEECTKFKEEYTKLIAEKGEKIQSLQDSLKKENTAEIWKAKYFDLLNKTKLASQSKQLKNVNSFNNHDWQSTNAGGKEEFTTDLNKKETPLPVVQKNFNAQVALNDKLYSIQIKYNNSTNQNSDEKQINNTVSKFFVINNPSTPMMHRKTQEIYSKPVDAGNEQKLRLKFPNGVVPIPFESNIMADDSAILSSEKVKDGQKVEQNEVPVQNEQKMEGLNIVNDEVVQKQSNNIVGDDENKLKNEVNDDQGKAYGDDDTNIDSQVEDEDDDEYADNRHRNIQQGQAVRER